MRTKGRGSQGYENLVRMKYSGFTVTKKTFNTPNPNMYVEFIFSWSSPLGFLVVFLFDSTIAAVDGSPFAKIIVHWGVSKVLFFINFVHWHVYNPPRPEHQFHTLFRHVHVLFTLNYLIMQVGCQRIPWPNRMTSPWARRTAAFCTRESLMYVPDAVFKSLRTASSTPECSSLNSMVACCRSAVGDCAKR